MKPYFHSHLVNDAYGDPLLYIDFVFVKRAILFDLGDAHALAPRKILRIGHIFVSHTHMDHFIGLDQLLRVCLGRDKALHLFGPPGLIAQVGHRLAGYTWNLVSGYTNDFTIVVHELCAQGLCEARFRVSTAFAREDLPAQPLADGRLLDEPTFTVRTAVLDHKIPCLGFALAEKQHVNIWKNRLLELGLPTGPWLADLKQAVVEGRPDDWPIYARWRNASGSHERRFALGELRHRLLHVERGQKIGYVVDAAYTEANVQRIVKLVRGADRLYIEAPFLSRDAARAAQTCHLTARQAGTIARLAEVGEVIPFHFSARHAGEEQTLRAEVQAAFCGSA